METFTATIKHYIDPTIKVGDIVRLIDGSALTHEEKKCHIVFSYPKLTGIHKKLKFIDCIVLKVNITNKIAIDPSFTRNTKIVYLQDIKIKCGNAVFRTSSGMVSKVEREGQKESE